MFWYILAYVSFTFTVGKFLTINPIPMCTSSVPFQPQVALFSHYKGLQMVKIIEGRHLGSTQSIDRWLADKKSGKKARTDTAHTYFLEQSKLQTQLLFFSWGFQSFKAAYIWGEWLICSGKLSPSYPSVLSSQEPSCHRRPWPTSPPRPSSTTTCSASPGFRRGFGAAWASSPARRRRN